MTVSADRVGDFAPRDFKSCLRAWRIRSVSCAAATEVPCGATSAFAMMRNVLYAAFVVQSGVRDRVGQFPRPVVILICNLPEMSAVPAAE